MTTNVDIYRENLKCFDCEVLSLEELGNLELQWIKGIEDQAEYASTHVLTQFRLNVKIARKWRSWNRQG